jgi:uncharacterized membrane protein
LFYQGFKHHKGITVQAQMGNCRGFYMSQPNFEIGTNMLNDGVEKLNNAYSQGIGELGGMVKKGETQLWSKCTAEQVAKGLGVFSLGLGLCELLMPSAVAKLCGGRGKNTALVRLFGLREIASGLAIFSQGRKPATGVWSRVLGDAMDIGSLLMLLGSRRSNKIGTMFALTNVLAVTALDVVTAQKLSQEKGMVTETGAVRAHHSIYINRQPQTVYEEWRNFENLPTFMLHLVSVIDKGDGKWRWVAKAPAGATVQWDAELLEDVPGKIISWRSLPGSMIQNSGTVTFSEAPGGRGCYLEVELQYRPPAGIISAAVAGLFREEPCIQLKDDLRRFKQFVELGEIVRSDASPYGNGAIMQRPAQPQSKPKQVPNQPAVH